MLVVVSIAIGIAAVGMVMVASRTIQRDLSRAQEAGDPASLFIYTSPFSTDLTQAVENLRSVERAQARRIVSGSAYNNEDQLEDISLQALEDYASIEVNRFTKDQGMSEPSIRQILLERKSADGLGIEIGEKLLVEFSDTRTYELTVSGIVHDVYQMPYSISGEAIGYVSADTLEWMGVGGAFNRMEIIVAEANPDREHVLEVAEEIRERAIEPAGYQVLRSEIPGFGSDPGEHWAQNQFDGLVLILQVIGFLAIFLSAGLVVNTVSAILVQQVKQIGIMRSFGATRKQLIGIYLVNVLVFSVLGLLIALPLSMFGAWGLSQYAAIFLNFDVGLIFIPIDILLLQMGLGLLMPTAVALLPILKGTQISIYNAIYQQGLEEDEPSSRLTGILARLKKITPPVVLSLRNTFRNKSRLGFTLITLTLAGAMFIAVFSTRSTLSNQLAQVARYVEFDASINLVPGAARHTAEREALRIPGVTVAEGWLSSVAVLNNKDQSQSEELQLVGLPRDSKTITPLMVEGRWFEQADHHAVVINEDLLDEEPWIKLGDVLDIEVGGKKSAFEVVGITSKHLSGPRIYMPYEDFGRLTDRHNQADSIRIRLDTLGISKPETQAWLTSTLEDNFDAAGLSKSNATTQNAIFSDFTTAFDVILIILMVMAGLLAIVGGLGLTGTLGINVLERTREIGVLRAVGASNRSVIKVVLVEGLVVGAFSWVLGAILSGPSGRALAAAVVNAVMQADLNYQYSFFGLFLWLLVVLLIGVLASLAPARRASTLTVREVLDYE
jgi:putative ABC transport system permease protein